MGEEMNKIVMAIASAALLSSCASMEAANKANQAKKSQFQETVPVCTGEPECTAMWEMAQLWVAKNSDKKIQTATNVLIETFGGGQYDATLAMRVTKEPQGGGVYRIVFAGGCNNMFGCVPDKIDMGLRFNQAVSAARP